MNLLAHRPSLGYGLAAAGFASGVLTWVKILTPILGFAGAAFGCAAGFLTLLIKWREYRNKPDDDE